MSRGWPPETTTGHPYPAEGRHHRPRRRRADAADVVYRWGVALMFTWIYLRTILVVAPGVDVATWTIFAYTGAPLLSLCWAGATATTAAWVRGR